ncbi:MAG: rRNA maturation RNase YbeY, partial [Victivallaceae bacterium]
MSRLIELSRVADNPEWIFNVIFVNDKVMTRLNNECVGHEGTTDVITFSYVDDMSSLFPGDTAVELFICADVAMREGDKRVDSSYARELTLYMAHGLLHASGEDDLDEKSRHRMRRREREVMKQIEAEFDLSKIFPESDQRHNESI